MESKFHEEFYKTKLEITMRDVAKIIQEPEEPIERYVAKFIIVRTNCSMVMTKRDYATLV